MTLPDIRALSSDFEIRAIDLKELIFGVALIGVSFLMPSLFTVQSFRILDYMSLSLEQFDSVDLMFAALRLIMLNALRCAPHYIGVYYIAESVQFYWRGRQSWIPNACMILVALRLVYLGINFVHHIYYDFGLPAFLLSGFVVLFRWLDYQYISRTKKTLLLLVFTVAFQFLDIMPAMHGMPVGRGEVSTNIKLYAQVLEAETLLNGVSIVGIVLFALFAVIIFLQLRDENSIRQLALEQQKAQDMRSRALLLEQQNRTYQEMKYLVHDLKSPLTSTQTLVGVLKMQYESEGKTRSMDYLDRIETQMDRMSGMISEILYEDRQSPAATKKLLDTALAQISVEAYAACVHIDNEVPEARVSVNSILFARVLVNLIRNAAQAAVDGRELSIWVRIRCRLIEDAPYVTFSVQDNGCGMTEKEQETMWECGVSGRGSSGLGLTFVQKTIEAMDGSVVSESKPGQGTKFTIFLPEVVKGGKQGHDSFD